jgi:formylglycine-generating enzyme required for sulfatase activity
MKNSTSSIAPSSPRPARRSHPRRAWLALAVLLGAVPHLYASRAAVAKVAWSAVPGAAGQHDIRLDLSWDDSWRSSSGAANWDAVWLFAKVRSGAAGAWRHATLSTSANDYAVAGTGGVAASFSPSTDGKGVFAYRQADGRGPIRWTGVTLRCLSPAGGSAAGADPELRVFALEMVQVPQGAFYVGDGVSPGRFHAGGAPSQPALITAAAPRLQNAAGGLWAERQGLAPAGGGSNVPVWDKPTGALPAAFPTGFQAFYVQKYEVTQGQYAAFLNTLTPRQAAARAPSSEELTTRPTARRRGTGAATLPTTYRYSIARTAPGLYTAAAPECACNFLAWEDGIAFADWAALRPLTEMEYEKVCRGSKQKPVPGECAWGTPRLSAMTDFQGIDGSGTETALPGDSNTLFQKSIRGPVRVGIHEAKPTRELAGAAYYGALDLSGNVTEYTVSLGSPDGRTFTGRHGDGELAEAGAADVPQWPAVGGEGAPAAVGRGRSRSGFSIRGGDWASPAAELRVSARCGAAYLPSKRLSGNGFRSARSAVVTPPPAK